MIKWTKWKPNENIIHDHIKRCPLYFHSSLVYLSCRDAHCWKSRGWLKFFFYTWGGGSMLFGQNLRGISFYFIFINTCLDLFLRQADPISFPPNSVCVHLCSIEFILWYKWMTPLSHEDSSVLPKGHYEYGELCVFNIIRFWRIQFIGGFWFFNLCSYLINIVNN